MGVGGATPSFSTPAMGGGAAMGGATPSFGTATPAGALAMGLATPTPMAAGAMTPEQMQSWRWERELDERNRPLSDEELDALFPQEGYKVRERWGGRGWGRERERKFFYISVPVLPLFQSLL